MTTAYWCALIAAVLPLAFAGLAKFGRDGVAPRYDNRAPRDWLERLSGWRKRAHWAQQNAHEAFGPFAAAVIIAHLAGAPQERVDLLALGFIVARLAHGALYLLDRSRLRSLVWAVGFGFMIALFVAAARA